MKKGRPESRQKKSDHTDGKMSTDLKKKNETSEKPTTKLTDGLKTVDSATSMIKAGEVDREKSSLTLEIRKSSMERKKSATGRMSTCRIANNSKNVRKFAGRKKRDKSGVDDDDDFDEKSGGAKLFEGKIWDKEIEKLALRKKRVSAMDREIGLNHVKILPPTPTIQTVGVRKKRVEKKAKIATVMKPAGSDAEIIHHLYKDKGPRYDQLGHIIPHSILGDVESFLTQSQQADKVCNILLVHTPRSQAVRGSKSVENNTSLYNLCVNQKNALNTWENEMEIRCKEKNRLAGLLKCDETELLMCRTGKRADKEAANILQRGDWRCHPDICFWKLAQTITAGQLHETLSKSDRGELPTPVLSGDADTILQEKSKVHKADLCTRFSGDSVTKKIESVKGKIQITNKVLFDKLFLQGEPVKSSEEAIGDNLAQSRGARLFMENRIDVSGGCTDESEEGKIGAFFSKFFGTRRMSKSVRETREMMKFKGISAEVDDEVCRGHESQPYDRSKRRKSTYGDVVMSEQISRMNKNRPVMDFRFVGLEK
ncbi:uncharacterized protein LOC132741958 isoform X2 [Ruditapes philippinarum]|uniref:uncharacterized protein LOC132741958 isoform X2 n=1 Tax=Ruditapes philippinarum TaxID=129788 RepID=UPI00295B3FBA|nr:uncharacterized protein LOC132741958 isoform X2 [Ruditapes philippinarum]